MLSMMDILPGRTPDLECPSKRIKPRVITWAIEVGAGGGWAEPLRSPECEEASHNQRSSAR